MNAVKFKNPTEALDYLYDMIMVSGRDTPKTRAMYNVLFDIEDPSDRVITSPWRKFKKEYADFECQWYLSQDRTWKMIGEAAKIWNSMGDQLNSNYGWQIQRNGQLSKIINLLAEDKNTRRAVITIYDGKEVDDYSQDTPCCLNFAFNIVDNKLNMTVHFRSQDLIFGFCNDQYTLHMYHDMVYKMLSHKRYKDLEFGKSSWFINDLHIYQQHFGMKQ